MRTSLMIFAGLVMLMFVASGCDEYNQYTYEKKGDSCIKFEDAMYYDGEEWVENCLGEDGAQEEDGFYVELDGIPTQVVVTVKAGKCKETITLNVVSDFIVGGEVCGFYIEGFYEEPGWWIGVWSDYVEGGAEDGTAALSNVTFCFVGASITDPSDEEGTVSVGRDIYQLQPPDED